MDSQLERRILEDQYKAFVELCHQKELEISELGDDEIHALDNYDLRRIVRQVRDLARTPVNR